MLRVFAVGLVISIPYIEGILNSFVDIRLKVYNCTVLLTAISINSVSGYKCYNWTDDDYEIINRGGWKKENERSRCVDHYNFLFAPDEHNWPRRRLEGCGDCWCCEPDPQSGFFTLDKD